jgi:hypothetical protein
VAQRLENELGEEQGTLVEGCQRDWNQWPPPDGPLTVGIDGGYLRGRNLLEGHCEVVAGKSRLAFRREAGEEEEELSGKCFAFVQTYEEKPQRRLFEVLRSQGLTMHHQVEFLSDGGEDVRHVPLYWNPEAEQLLDWFPLTMRLTVLLQTAQGMPEKNGEGEEPYERRPRVEKHLESIQWYWWHGNAFQALNQLESLEMDLEAVAYESQDDNMRKLLKGVEKVHTAHLRGTQPAVLAQLRRALSPWGTDRVRLRGIGCESGGEPTNGKTATDAVGPTRRASAVEDESSSNPGVQSLTY